MPLKCAWKQFLKHCDKVSEKLRKGQFKTLENLTLEKQRLEILVSRIIDGAILLDNNLHIILINPAAVQLLDLQLVSTKGKKITECLSFEIASQLLPRFKKLMNTSSSLEADFPVNTQEFTIRSTSKQKKILRVFLNLAAVSKYSSSKYIVMTIKDITKEIELNDVRNEFISNLSHELKTPLSNIRSFLETLYEYNESLTDMQKLEFLDIANKETARLSSLLNDILNLSRSQLDKENKFQLFETSLLIEQVISLYQFTIKEKNIKFIIQIEPNLPQIYANYDLVFQSVLNLVSNALKFTYENGQIVIRALYIENLLESSKKIRIEVSDTGIGIADMNQHLIFERFSRVKTRSYSSDGTGLGLSIVKNNIQKHHSDVLVRSEINSGSTFWFDL